MAGGSIKNSNSSGSVSGVGGADTVGGLVGQTASDTTIDNSWASGTVSSNGGAAINYGGLVGHNVGTISNSWANGTVSSNGDSNTFYGGLVGHNNGNISNSWASGNVFSRTRFQNTEYGGLVGVNITGTISNSWASGNVFNPANNLSYGGLVGTNGGVIRNSWASGEINSSGNAGGLVGDDSSRIQGRNYQLDDDQGTGVDLANNGGIGESFILGGMGGNNDATGLRALEMLSGATSDGTSDWRTKSNWHAGFDLDNPSSTATADFDDITKYCDTNKNGMIDLGNVVGNPDERTANNSVWVMAGADSANNLPLPPTTNEAGGNQNYYAIPALRCIANTAGITDQTEIDAMRKIEIDRQRRLFAK